MSFTFAGLELRTQRLVLRPLRHTDADALFSIFANPEVARYTSTPPWTDRQQAVSMIDAEIEAVAKGTAVRLGLMLNGTEPIIGMCTLFNFHHASRRAEIGYILGRASWGHGLMHEALVALVDYAFDTLDLNRLEADVDPRNAPSVRVVERLGFVREGTLRQRWIVGGEVSDTAFFGLLRSDRQARP